MNKINVILIILLSCFLFGCQNTRVDNEEKNDNFIEENYMYIKINDNVLKVKLYENDATNKLLEILTNSDLTYTADDFGNFEKVGTLPISLPTNDEYISVSYGDVVLYQGNKLCLYYDNNRYSFTKIGKIECNSKEEIQNLLGAFTGTKEVTLTLNY